VQHRLELDGLRGAAILLVVLSHAGWVPGGFTGVDLFFALSGYLITTKLLAEVDRSGTVQLGAFYRRRVARLAPALVVALVAAAVAHNDTAGALLVLCYCANIALAIAPTTLSPTWGWSLSLEEQFYLLWPTLLRGGLRRIGARRLALGLVVGAFVLAVSRVAAPPRIGYALLRGDDIMLGCAVALVGLSVGKRSSALAAVALLGCQFFSITPYTVAFVLPVAAVSCAALVAGAEGWRVLRWAPLRHFGQVSYAWYLWNGVLAGTHTAIRLIVSLALAELSTWLLERPAQGAILARRRPTIEVPPVLPAEAP
jgi:peptidoglycan/LPS O-acetylase OafA/YrhL